MSEYDCVEIKHAGVVQHVLVHRTFRAAIRRSEIKTKALVKTSGISPFNFIPQAFVQIDELFEVSIYFVRRGKQDSSLGAESSYRFEHIETTQNIGLEIFPRIGDGSRHGHLAGQMKNGIGLEVGYYFLNIIYGPKVAVD